MVTPGDIDQSEALAYSEDEDAVIPFAPIGDGDGDADEEANPDEDERTDEGDDSIPGFGVTAGAAGVTGGTAYAAAKLLESSESNESVDADATE